VRAHRPSELKVFFVSQQSIGNDGNSKQNQRVGNITTSIQRPQERNKTFYESNKQLGVTASETATK